MLQQRITAGLAALDRIARAHELVPAPRLEAAPDCLPALVVVGVDPRSPVSRAVDKATGERGFSHVYVDPCVALDGRHAIVDYTVRRGLHLASPSTYDGRRLLRVELQPDDARALWACVRGRMGKPLRVTPLVFGRESKSTCIGVVVACMPPSFRAALEPLREGPCISPNTVARWVGAA